MFLEAAPSSFLALLSTPGGFKGPLHKMLPRLMSPPYPQPRSSVQLKLQTLNIHSSLLGSKCVYQHHRFIKTGPNSSPPPHFQSQKSDHPDPLTIQPLSLPPPLIGPQFFTVLSPKAFSHLSLLFPILRAPVVALATVVLCPSSQVLLAGGLACLPPTLERSPCPPPVFSLLPSADELVAERQALVVFSPVLYSPPARPPPPARG